MTKTDAFCHSSLTAMLRDHKKQMLSRDKMLLGCDAEAKSAQDLSELDEQDLWDLTENSYSSANIDYHHHHHHHTKVSPLVPKINIPQTQQSNKVLHRQQSAPVNVPDWSKILGSSANSKHANGGGLFDYDDDDDEDVYEQRIPPHEVVARDYARSHVMTFSVHEGAGHTLKGRDMSRVRNAVLKQTGFL